MQRLNKTELENRVFKALSEPTRRKILKLLVLSLAALNINQLTEEFNMTRQAVAKHLKILERAGLVAIQNHGRERMCLVQLENLKIVQEWVNFYSKSWEKSLKSLGNYLEKGKA